jgi:hypothetical protein
MAETGFKNFGDLYRAAYAESNAERKVLLMSQVKRALDEWAQTPAAHGSTLVAKSAAVLYQSK